MEKLFNCEHSKNGKCIHCYSEGELECDGTEDEMSKCGVYLELE